VNRREDLDGFDPRSRGPRQSGRPGIRCPSESSRRAPELVAGSPSGVRAEPVPRRAPHGKPIPVALAQGGVDAKGGVHNLFGDGVLRHGGFL
jgi:hypothetical protein